MTKEETEELFVRLWKLDDKPHQLFSYMRVLVQKYGKNYNSVYRQELLNMADLGYENAYKLLRETDEE